MMHAVCYEDNCKRNYLFANAITCILNATFHRKNLVFFLCISHWQRSCKQQMLDAKGFLYQFILGHTTFG